jgi:hypothetical protein
VSAPYLSLSFCPELFLLLRSAACECPSFAHFLLLY